MGSSVNVCVIDDFTMPTDTFVHYTGLENDEMKVAYLSLLFVYNFTDGRAMRFVLTLITGNYQDMGDVGPCRHDPLSPVLGTFSMARPVPSLDSFFDPSTRNLGDLWRNLGRGTSSGGLDVGIIIIKLGLQPKLFGKACSRGLPAFRQAGDFIKNARTS